MNKKPTAHITVGKNRLKKGKSVYLNDGTEFEIELYNPTSTLVSAEIYINNKRISNKQIVIYPAQRIHLDRYLDKSSKFKFSTYKVSGSDAEIKEAIKNNGLIKVIFYKERKDDIINHTIFNKGIFYGNDNGWNNRNNILIENPFFCDTTGTMYTSDASNTYTSSISNISGSLEFKSDNLSKKITESGRVGEGSQSNQKLTSINANFSNIPLCEYEYNILPKSSKPVIDSNDINVTTYCTNCGYRKRKASWKFCPKCGNKILD